MNKFVNREKELRWLKGQCENHGLAILYGRRRVGKTELIEEALENRRSIYFLADQKPEKENISALKRAMAKHIDDDLFQETDFEDWVRLFEAFAERVNHETIIAIDEFPYLISQNDAIPSIFQKIWDQVLEDKKIGLILCGSSISMMETHTLEYRSPLYGRRTGQWQLKPFGFRDIQEFFPTNHFEEVLQFYSFLDGIPAYLLKMDPEKSVEWNLKKKVLSKGNYLYEEAEFLLRQEFREPTNYFAILQAIAEGNTGFGEIVNRTDLAKSTVSQYISNLRELYVVKRDFPITQKKESRNSLYRLSDNYYSFWFDIVYPNKGLVEQDKQEVLLENVSQRLKHKTASGFEQVCREISTTIFEVNEVGRWWRNEHEIDVVGINKNENLLLLGECKWTNSPVKTSVLKQLEEESELVRWGGKDRKEKYVIYSKSGFTENLINRATERDDLELYDLERIRTEYWDNQS